VGYDPSYNGEQADVLLDGRVTFVPALLPDHLDGRAADMIVARHVLEHLELPVDVLRTLRAAMGGHRAVLYAEVPDGGYLLQHTAVWDVIYEHPSHFTASSLHRLCAEAGLPVTRRGTSFGGQYLWAEASSSRSAGSIAAPATDGVLAAVTVFSARAAGALAYWAHEVETAVSRGQKVALWGAGSKGVTFLNVVPGAREVELVVDVNPRKHGRHVPGTGQVVLGPEQLPANPPDLVIVLNPVYVDEVRAALGRLGLRPEVRTATTAAGSAQC
jgi:hypothetical protein